MSQETNTDEDFHSYLTMMKGIITEHGWAVQGVGGNEKTVSYVYSIGLSKNTAYELIALALPMRAATSIVNSAARLIIEKAIALDETVVFETIANFPIRVRAIASIEAEKVCRMAERLLPIERNSIQYFQLIWPDEHGLYPGEAGCETWVVDDQDISKLIEK
jgi:Domain of unknown function (DUF4262)